MLQRHHATLSFSSLNEAQRRQFLMQSNQDLADRSIPGTFYYVVVWFCIAYLLSGSNQPSEVIDWVDAISVLIVTTSTIRVVLIYLAKRYLEYIHLSRWLLIVGMVISSVSWGVMACFAFLDTPLASQQEVIFISTIGLCGGGTLSFCASRLFTSIFLTCMMLPILVVTLLIAEDTNLAAMTVIMVYFMGLLSASKHPHREYLSSLISYLELEEISNTDALTEVKNRRYFDTQLGEEVRRASRTHSPLSILLLDVDHFKQINDRYGHPAGDKCLINMARRLKGAFHRVSDTIARVGGEEFAVILPNISENECLELAERIREDIAASSVDVDQESLRLTVSIGVCSVASVSSSINSELLVAKADKALYQAKRLGRNRVEIAANTEQGNSAS